MELHGEDHGLFYEVREKLWNGSINITIRLHVDDTVKEFLLSIHRNSYFALYFESIVSYFKLFIPSIYNKPVWLEYDGQPIKWNVPVGVLYDYLYLPSVIIARANDTTTTQIKNSWVLELKYDKYPSGEIIPFIYQNDDLSINYKRMLNEVIVNQLKQSCYVLNSSSKPIMGLSESDSNHLWYGIETHNWMTFNAINSKIIPTFDAFRIPIRIYVSGEVTVIQNPISPTKGDSPTTLNDVLDHNVPHLQVSTNSNTVYIHGIDATPLLNESILQVWNTFKHLDNFLYIIIIKV